MHSSDDAGNDLVQAQQAKISRLLKTSYLDVLNHERFPLARNHYMQVIVDQRATDTVMRHFMQDFGRTVLFNIVLGHHARTIVDPSLPPLTVGRLRDVFMPFGLASPRSFDQMLARMQVIGLVTLEPIPDDRRRKLIIPTQKMIDEDLVWLADYMSPLAVLYPEVDDYEPARQHDLRYQRAQRIISTENYHLAVSTMSLDDTMLFLLQRQDSMPIIYRYMLEAHAAGTPHMVSLPFEEVAAYNSSSRTHVRNLLNDLQAINLVRLHGRGGNAVELSPELWTSIEIFLAKGMWGHDLVWQQARLMVAQQEQALHAKNSASGHALSA